MKKHISLFTFLFYLFLSSCSSVYVSKTPEGIGKATFKVIQNLQSNSLDRYLASFMSIEEIRQMAEDTTLVTTQKMRDEMTKMPSNKLKELRVREYKLMLKTAKEDNIDWSKITYEKFTFDEKVEDGVRAIKGELYFKSDHTIYAIQSFSINNGTRFKLIGLKDLNKMGD